MKIDIENHNKLTKLGCIRKGQGFQLPGGEAVYLIVKNEIQLLDGRPTGQNEITIISLDGGNTYIHNSDKKVRPGKFKVVSDIEKEYEKENSNQKISGFESGDYRFSIAEPDKNTLEIFLPSNALSKVAEGESLTIKIRK